MAAHFGFNNALSQIGGVAALTPQSLLPSGSCKYRDLGSSTSASACGCQRFWLNSDGGIQQQERAYCFCGHHACYHDAGTSTSASATANGIIHNPFESRIGGSTQIHQSGYTQLNRQHHVGAAPIPTHAHDLVASHTTRQLNDGLGIRDPSQSINTRLWHALNGFARGQDDGQLSDTTSRIPSTRVPSLFDEARASPARVLREQQQRWRPPSPSAGLAMPFEADKRIEEYSATEVATPSVRGTPDFRAATLPPPPVPRIDLMEQMRPSTSHPAPAPIPEATVQDRGCDAMINDLQRPDLLRSMSLQQMENTIRDFSRRIGTLESLSFSNMPTDEILDKFDLMDGRVLDLEVWRTDLDKARSSPEHETTSKTRRTALLPSESGSFASDDSFDSTAAAQTEAVVLATLAASAEIVPRVDMLESRIADLETTTSPSPSYSRPWHVEVVLLPFGRHLPGIWFSSVESTEHSLRSSAPPSQEWNGATAAAKSSFASNISGAWTTDSITAWARDAHQEWLSPKACGPNGTVFQRLASRGFVRNIKVTSPDARHIGRAIFAAFSNVLSDESSVETALAEKLPGLQERFIPLRKVRKSSRLRFLGPAEMATAALWTADFLEACVFMKVDEGHRRLYMTTPEAYTQPPGEGWTWTAIKRLQSIDIHGRVHHPYNDSLIEACWTHSEKLDRADYLDSSFDDDQESIWSTRSQSSARSHQVHGGRQPSTDMHRLRSLSLPSVAVEAAPALASLAKRRVASYDTIASAAPEPGASHFSKRRRVSGSPELERRGVNFTPRWSREPPSPYIQSDDLLQTRSQAMPAGKRGITPTAYATPHSHLDSSRVGDRDMEHDSDDRVGSSEHAEYPEEWEGVQDGPSIATMPLPAAGFDDEVDDNSEFLEPEEDDDEEDDDE